MEDKQEKAEKELFALYKKTKDPEIKKEITMQYLYIARTTATKLYDLYSTTMQMEDAVNEGVVAIIKGIDMYDPDKNIKFSTYIAGKRSNAGLCKKTGVDAPGILQAVGDYRICMRGHEA